MPKLAQQLTHACVQDSFVTPNSESTHINFLNRNRTACYVSGRFDGELDGTAEMHAKEYLYPSLFPGISRIAICYRESYRARNFNTRVDQRKASSRPLTPVVS